MARIGSASSIGFLGLRAFTVHMQAFVSQGLPYFSIIGLPDTSLSEARERVRSACQAAGFSWPQTRVTVNLSPASMPKRGSAHDLAIAASVLGAAGKISSEALERTVVLGELNLDGSVLPVPGVLPAVVHAKSQGMSRVIVPAANIEEAELVPDIAVTGVRHVGELIELLGGHAKYTLSPSHGDDLPDGERMDVPATGDMSEVIGQDHTKWALQVAAAGGHHALLVGPPGAGKTMLASRLPGIMRPLGEDEQLEVASVRSLCGTLPRFGITDVPPYEAPHHTASSAALVGGGSGVAVPGAITRAHRGVLFMDEAPEFSTRALQTLREPLESGCIALSRAKGTAWYPARFLLVMAANPCPCGYAYGDGERCTCRERDRIRYFSRLSGPILDRIDIQVEVPPINEITLGDQGANGKDSATMRAEVSKARDCAAERFQGYGWTCNAQADGVWLREHTSRQAVELVNRALDSGRLSLRGADRAMRLAWTLADMRGGTSPDRQDMAQGIALRTRMR